MIIGSKEQKGFFFSLFFMHQDVIKKMGDACFRGMLREPVGTGRPISVRNRMSCSLNVCFGRCQPLPSVFVFFHPSFFIVLAALSSLPGSSSAVFYSGSLSGGSFADTGRNVKSASI